MAKFKVSQHILVPKHSKLSETEKKEVLARYSISVNDLPKILTKDPAIAHLGIKEGDVIKIERNSPTAGDYIFFRRVSNA